jgi:hypothetical protein
LDDDQSAALKKSADAVEDLVAVLQPHMWLVDLRNPQKIRAKADICGQNST